MAGIAEGAALEYEQIVCHTIRNSLSFLPVPQACTTFVVRGEDGRCVLGKTQDVGRLEGEYQLINELRDEQGRRAVVSGLVGTIWAVAGMNGDGLCAGINSGPVITDPPVLEALPQHQALYPLLKHEATVTGALKSWLRQPLVGKGICGCLCDRLGQAVTFERAGTRYAVVDSSGSLHHTNHYRDAGLLAVQAREGSDNSYARERRLNQRLAGRTFADPAAEARSILTDPEGEGAVCRVLDDQACGTYSAYLADPVAGTFAVADGQPHLAEWRSYSLT